MIERRNLIICILLFIILVESLALLWIRRGLKPVREAKVPTLGRAAIVVDDWGYSISNLPLLYQINQPLTISILPNLRYSTYLAKELEKRNFEIVLHLPLEPKVNTAEESFGLESDTIYCGMSKREVIERFLRSLKSIPTAKGVSNHMGSKATEDEGLMEIIFRQIKKRGLYFLDSLVTDSSVCERLSKKMRLKFAKRDIFLDNQQDPDYIRKQLGKLANLAKQKGEAVGIGHDRDITLKEIKKTLPQLEKEGIEFVYLSELMR